MRLGSASRERLSTLLLSRRDSETRRWSRPSSERRMRDGGFPMRKCWSASRRSQGPHSRAKYILKVGWGQFRAYIRPR